MTEFSDFFGLGYADSGFFRFFAKAKVFQAFLSSTLSDSINR